MRVIIPVVYVMTQNVGIAELSNVEHILDFFDANLMNTRNALRSFVNFIKHQRRRANKMLNVPGKRFQRPNSFR